jgi:demethylmenaquinone methyltransferase/2-methoxy-6-polyprenyl-1,4-benzoquinol methylase
VSHGTTPAGVQGEEQAARWVRSMFGKVAPRYDLLNHLLSFQIDRYWRSRTVAAVANILERPTSRVLDLCCGTGDLMLALEKRRGSAVLGSDFCHPMLTAAREKTSQRRRASEVFESDALQLPIADRSLDLITVAFGFRNLANYARGLAELKRVLRPGGQLAILEFSQPPNPVFAALYGIYSKRILPLIGGLISGSGEAYTYLPESVSKFPGPEELAEQMRSAGFSKVRFERMTFGIVALHTGTIADAAL